MKTMFGNPIATRQPDADIREQMWERLPRWMQPWLTEVTGKAATHEPTSNFWTWRSRLFAAIAALAGSVAGSIWLVNQQDAVFWLLLPVTWLVSVSVLQALDTVYLHYATHGRLTGQPAVDALIGYLLSLVTLLRPFNDYRREHGRHHGRLALSDDANLQLIAGLGFRPGMPRRYYWEQLGRTIISPRFHGQMMLSRVRSNFANASKAYRRVAVVAAGATLALVTLSGTWPEFLIAWLIPLVPLLHVSLVMELLTEHTWVRRTDGPDPRAAVAAVTHARFFGEALPSRDLPLLRRALKWVGWWMRMLLVHLPARLFVAPSDLPNHDWHHRYPLAKTWPNAAYARRDDLVAGGRGWPAYTERWGLKAMLSTTFGALNNLPRSATLGEPETYQR